MTNEHDHLDVLLHSDASRELAGTDSALADRLIARLDTPPRRSPVGPVAVVGMLAIAAITVLTAVSFDARDAAVPAPPLAGNTHHRSEIDPAVVVAIDDATDSMLDPLRRELSALAAISRDSVRTFASFLPNRFGS
ncbi:MAG: hypothetical protein KDA16_12505 [Phycisphaerales bacterium]|nr:hypothetical protein [Phycisphaerales bacterium]